MSKMMKCGCVAQGVVTAIRGEPVDPPAPACVIHDCYEVAEAAPDLTGRQAHCAYGKHAFMPSSFDLAFFEYRGPGSRDATEICTCGLSRKPHDENGGKIPRGKYSTAARGCSGFTPKGPQEHDRYYCGCRGWD